MPFALKWLPEALNDLQRLHRFIANYNPSSAAKAINAILESTEKLAAFPELGRPWEPAPDYRELPVTFGARGYLVRYRIFKRSVVIVRIWHAFEDR